MAWNSQRDRRRGKSCAWRQWLGIAAAVGSISAGVVHTATYFRPQHSQVQERAPTPGNEIQKRPLPDKSGVRKKVGPGRCGALFYWRDGRCADKRDDFGNRK